jgi:hypothetical protein
MVRFLRRDDDGAIEMLHKAIALNPNFAVEERKKGIGPA